MPENRTAKIASIIEQRRPFKEKIGAVKANINALALNLKNLAECRDRLIPQVEDLNVINCLQEINFLTIQSRIAEELAVLTKLEARFSRDTLNIGVVGRARQGKSRLLQSLTGLTAAEIPDGDRQHCTGVRSMIHHHPNVETYGEVWFHSERSFLDEVIAPYYDKLSFLGRKPITIQEFASNTLPALPEKDRGSAVIGAMYEHLSRYHQRFHEYRHLLQQSSPRRITKDAIREYVAQDNLSGDRIYFNYLAVREVKIFCSFPNADVGQISLVDMPGLGDTGLGDEDRLVKTLGQEVDAVLFVRMPSAKGDFLGDVDVKLYDTARSALVDLPINLWSFMVFNRTGTGSKNGDNLLNCQDLAGEMANKHINVVECVTANCANGEEANEVLDRVLDYLVLKITALDKQYTSLCQQKLFDIQKAVDAELNKARNVLAQTKQLPELAHFEVLFDGLWDEITSGLERFLMDLDKQINKQDRDFEAQVKAALQACRSDPGIPTEQEIEVRRDREKSYEIAYNQYLNEIRSHLSEKFLSLDDGLKRSLDRVKLQVAKILVEQGRLGGLTAKRGADFIGKVAERIPEELIPGQPSKLKFGFQILAEFTLSYRGMIQHRIRKCLNGITPDTTTLSLSKSPNAKQVLSSLKSLQSEAVYECENTLEKFLCEPSQAAFAIMEEFLDRVLRAEGVKTEWRIFLNEERSTIWPSEFEQLGERTRQRREWLTAIENVATANQSDLMQFIQ